MKFGYIIQFPSSSIESIFEQTKKAEDRDGLIVRFYNPYDEMIIGTLRIPVSVKEAYLCNLAEDRQEELEHLDGNISLEVPAKKIITCEISTSRVE